MIYIYMQHIHWGISLPSKTLAFSLFCQATHKSENFQSPPPPPHPLQPICPCTFCFFAKLSKIKFFSEPPQY